MKLKLAILAAVGLAVGGVLSHESAGFPEANSNKILALARPTGQEPAGTQKIVDPAAWGSNHVGKPVPEFIHGDECLFCHRNDIGPGWQKNSHGITLRQQEDAPDLAQVLKAQQAMSALSQKIEYFLGSRNRVRFLRKQGYGKLALLNTQVVLGPNGRGQQWLDADKPAWDKDRFGDRCAGCHATGVDPATRSFAAFGLDCYTCHGVVDLDHTKDTSLVFLSKKRRRDARSITSTCAQCHLRMGNAKSTGLPYPNNFVAGDNLFQDYQVDFSKADDPGLNPGDRHILRNVREVVVYGSEFPTCLSCHDLHKQSTVKHRRAPRTAACTDCHNAEGPLKVVKPYTVSSPLCEY